MSRFPEKTFWSDTTAKPTRRPTAPADKRKGRGIRRSVEEVDVEVDVVTAQSQRDEIQAQMFGSGGGQLQNMFQPMGGIRSDVALNQSQSLLHGSPLAICNPFLLSRYNGFGCNLTQNAYDTCAPGSFYGHNFRDGNFFVSCVPATASPNSYRLLNPQFINETGAKATSINGIAHRIVILQMGVTYTFTFDGSLAGSTCNDGRSLRSYGWYFSFDACGGSLTSSINRQSNDCCDIVNKSECCPSASLLPGILPETTLMTPGTTICITPNANWGQAVYLNSLAPFDSCLFIIVSNIGGC